MSVADLCDPYLELGIETKKLQTISGDRGRINRHIKPLIGGWRASEVTTGDVERLMKDIASGKTQADFKTGRSRSRVIVRGGKGAATRTIEMLSAIFSFAQRQGICNHNPCRGVKRYPDGASEQFLSSAEIAILGVALSKAESEGANGMLAAQVSNRHATLLLTQYPDNLLFVKPALLHRLLLKNGIRLYSFLGQFAGLRSRRQQK
jgi:hypothetical protein